MLCGLGGPCFFPHLVPTAPSGPTHRRETCRRRWTSSSAGGGGVSVSRPTSTTRFSRVRLPPSWGRGMYGWRFSWCLMGLCAVALGSPRQGWGLQERRSGVPDHARPRGLHSGRRAPLGFPAVFVEANFPTLWSVPAGCPRRRDFSRPLQVGGPGEQAYAAAPGAGNWDQQVNEPANPPHNLPRHLPPPP